MRHSIRLIALGCLTAGMTISGLIPASAHHSRQAYDRNTQTSITGEVRSFEFANPHAWIYLSVTKPDGTVENWDFEGGSIRRLSRSGWSRDLPKAGDEITVIFNPKRDGSPGGIFRSVATSDGTVHSASRRR